MQESHLAPGLRRDKFSIPPRFTALRVSEHPPGSQPAVCQHLHQREQRRLPSTMLISSRPAPRPPPRRAGESVFPVTQDNDAPPAARGAGSTL